MKYTAQDFYSYIKTLESSILLGSTIISLTSSGIDLYRRLQIMAFRATLLPLPVAPARRPGHRLRQVRPESRAAVARTTVRPEGEVPRWLTLLVGLLSPHPNGMEAVARQHGLATLLSAPHEAAPQLLLLCALSDGRHHVRADRGGGDLRLLEEREGRRRVPAAPRRSVRCARRWAAPGRATRQALGCRSSSSSTATSSTAIGAGRREGFGDQTFLDWRRAAIDITQALCKDRIVDTNIFGTKNHLRRCS